MVYRLFNIELQAKRIDNYVLEESHVWILPQYLEDSWWELDSDIISTFPNTQNCSNEEMLTIMNNLNVIVIDSMKYNVPELQTRSEFNGQFYKLVSNISVSTTLSSVFEVIGVYKYLSCGKIYETKLSD